MKKNVGSVDRIIRFILGIILVVLGLIYQTTLAWIGLIVGVVLLTTAAMNFCPLYTVIKTSTLKQAETKQ